MAFMYGERLLIVVLLVAVTATAFVPRNVAPCAAATTTATAFRRMMVAKELSSNDVVESESFDFDDEDDDEEFEDDEESEPSAETSTSDRLTSSRWSSLNPAVKERIIQKGQERAIANKKKREPDQDKKRREYLSRKLLRHPLFSFVFVLTSFLSFHLRSQEC
jgi:hypothetical protein